jgi:sporulation protein YlmC with PRC-barrel domain
MTSPHASPHASPPDGYNGKDVIDPAGERIGKVTDVIFDSADLEPAWLVVNPGLFKAERYVPVKGASAQDDRRLTIPYDLETVQAGPKAARDHTMSSVTRSVLRDHYHLSDP